MLPLPLVCFYEKRKEVDREFIAVYYNVSFFRKPTFNGLYTPFGSPVSGGQKPSLPLRKASPLNLQISCDFLGGYEKSRTFGKLYK